MKKLLISILSIILILSLCACGANTTEDSNNSSSDLSNQEELLNEETSDVIEGTSPKQVGKGGTGGYQAFADAKDDFDDFVLEISMNDETLMNTRMLVLSPEIEMFDYMIPLYQWGETLEDEELELKEYALSALTGVLKSFRSADLQRESNNSYIMTIEKEEEDIHIWVEYRPHIDALRLVAKSNGEQALLFEYAKTADGYATQYYYNSVVGGTYGVQNKAMCVYRAIFSGKEGSYARFDDVEEPASLFDGVPNEQEFIKGATHWFTFKDGKFTGELNGTAL